MERFEDAEKMYKKVLSLRPYFELAIFDLAALYEKQNKINKAIKLYRDYYEENPTRMNIRIKIGDLIIKDKKNEEAINEYQEVLKSDPDNREERIKLGILSYDMRRFDSAASEFSVILDKNILDSRY